MLFANSVKQNDDKLLIAQLLGPNYQCNTWTGLNSRLMHD